MTIRPLSKKTVVLALFALVGMLQLLGIVYVVTSGKMQFLIASSFMILDLLAMVVFSRVILK